MPDMQPLTDAFAELERRADAHAETAPPDIARRGRQRYAPALLIAASVVLVLALAGVVVVLARGTGPQHASPVGGAPSPSMSPTAPVASTPPSPSQSPSAVIPSRSVAPTPSESGTASGPPPSVDPSGTPSTPSHPGAGPSYASTAAQMTSQLRGVLAAMGNQVSISVSQRPGGDYIIGVLTAADGRQGGFDIQELQSDPGERAMCEDEDTSHCVISRPRGGGSLAVGHEATEDGGTLYQVDYVHPNGVQVLMHLSNLSDPKGAGTSFGNRPPLTLAQTSAIVTSPAWNRV